MIIPAGEGHLFVLQPQGGRRGINARPWHNHELGGDVDRDSHITTGYHSGKNEQACYQSAPTTANPGRLFPCRWGRCSRGWGMGLHRAILLCFEATYKKETSPVLRCFASLRWFRGLCSQDASFSRTLSTI